MSFFEKYKRNPVKYEQEQLAFEYLVKDTLIDNLKGPSKSKQVTGLDMESSVSRFFVPSLFYTFKYNSPNEDTVKKYIFKDTVPLIFCLKDDNDWVYGLNFNLLPTDVRASLLDTIYETNPTFYESEIYSDGLHINTNLISVLSSDSGISNFLNYLNTNFGLNISKAYRKYNKHYIENARLIEYDVWEYIPYLVFKDAIRGANLASVQKSIIESTK
jgi:hypothetical protein